MELIIVEGVDNVGKSTQVRLLSELLRAPIKAFPEKDDPWLQTLDRSLLLSDDAHFRAFHILCADQIRSFFERNRVRTVVDRFWPSNVAYACARLGGSPDAYRAQLGDAIVRNPKQVVVFLDATPEQVASRTPKDALDADLAFQKRVYAAYHALDDGSWIRIADAAKKPPIVVFREIVDALQKVSRVLE